MKRIIFTLCLLISLTTLAYAEDFKKCLDKDGNYFFTNNPPPGAKCESTGIEHIKSIQDKKEQGQSQTGNIRKEEIKRDEPSGDKEIIKRRVQNCVTCCKDKKQAFLNMNQDLRLSEALLEECIANCQAEGNSSAAWSDCWF